MNRLSLGMVAVIVLGLCGGSSAEGTSADRALARAERFVESSSRYLHHRHLRAGMKGYGLSVFSGTTIERFDVEIVSVVRGLSGGPRQDAVLAVLSGQGLERSRVIEGMSGSPVYVKDPRDGKDKLIGAVAFGWSLANEPQCGIQPITQMLALSGILSDDAPTSAPAAKRSLPRMESVSSLGASPAGRMEPKAFWNVALHRRKGTFAELFAPQPRGGSGGQMRPLPVPMSVSGCGGRGLADLQSCLESVGVRPVAAGSLPAGELFGGLSRSQLRAVTLQPGSAVAIPLVTGDLDWSAVGTVTEVIGPKVLAFGHSMFGEGVVELPMGTAYVHQVVNTLVSSFKLGSSIRTVGVLNRDEEVAVGGRVGPSVSMIPMTVTVEQTQDARRQTFHYRLARERFYTPMLAWVLVDASAGALRLPPVEHHVRYDVRVDFGELGEYRAANLSTDEGVHRVSYELARPIYALLNNPFGPAPLVKKIDVQITIRPGNRYAEILSMHLDGSLYAPGQKVTAQVVLEPYRRDRVTVPVSLRLPADLPDGEYTLTVGDADFAGDIQQRENPQDFSPRTVAELFASLQRVVAPKNDRLYLHLPLPRGGLAVGTQTLPELPSGKAQTLLQARLGDTRTFRSSLLRGRKIQYIPVGTAAAKITVRKRTNETLLREK